MIDLTPQELEVVVSLLQSYLHGCEVRAFGSRVEGTTKPYSDLDLVAVAEHPVDKQRMSELREAFRESDLPFRVDLLDWSQLSTEFRAVINQNYEIIQHVIIAPPTAE